MWKVGSLKFRLSDRTNTRTWEGMRTVGSLKLRLSDWTNTGTWEGMRTVRSSELRLIDRTDTRTWEGMRTVGSLKFRLSDRTNNVFEIVDSPTASFDGPRVRRDQSRLAEGPQPEAGSTLVPWDAGKERDFVNNSTLKDVNLLFKGL